MFQHPPWIRWPSNYYLARHAPAVDQVHSPYVFVTADDPPWLMDEIRRRGRIWYFETSHARVPDPDGYVLASLKRHGRVVRTWDFYEVRLYLFDIPPDG